MAEDLPAIEDLLLMHFDGSDHQFVVALDKHTGRTVWRTQRSVDFQDLNPEGKPRLDGDLRKGFSTPVIATVDGRPQMISLGSMACYGYDPRTGEEIWRVEYRGCHSGSPTPVVGDGMAGAAGEGGGLSFEKGAEGLAEFGGDRGGEGLADKAADAGDADHENGRGHGGHQGRAGAISGLNCARLKSGLAKQRRMRVAN